MRTITLETRRGRIEFRTHIPDADAASLLAGLVERGETTSSFAQSLVRQYSDGALRPLSQNQLDWVQFLLWDHVERPDDGLSNTHFLVRDQPATAAEVELPPVTINADPSTHRRLTTLDEARQIVETHQAEIAHVHGSGCNHGSDCAHDPIEPSPVPRGHVTLPSTHPRTGRGGLIETFEQMLRSRPDAVNPQIRLRSVETEGEQFDLRIRLFARYRRDADQSADHRLARGLEIRRLGRPYGIVTADGAIHVRRALANRYDRTQGILMRLNASREALAQTTADQGRRVGRCCFCASPLTDERSTSAGYGPVCAGHWGLPWGDRPANTPEPAPAVNFEVTNEHWSPEAMTQLTEDVARAARMSESFSPQIMGTYIQGGQVHPPEHINARSTTAPVSDEPVDFQMRPARVRRQTHGFTGNRRDTQRGNGQNTSCAHCYDPMHPVPEGDTAAVDRNGFRICSDCAAERITT